MTTPSLLHYFEAPDHYLGTFGWMCGYSADCNFLDHAAERFTRQTSAQRSHQGQISLALMLDPAHTPITMTDAPGVAHLIFKPKQKKPFALLHAKVAVLGFRHENEPNRWLVRLIVSTGNWTVQTVTESLDLVSCIECSSEDLQQQPAWINQNCTDISAAWQMLDWLRDYFDMRILHAKSSYQPVSLTEQSMQWLNDWLITVTAQDKSNTSPRYFDNRKQSLLAQLVPMIKQQNSDVKRNYLGMGSGFFEGSNGAGQLPSVLSKIKSTLQDAGLLTGHPVIDVFVNPNACQAVAEGFNAMQSEGYSIRAAAQNAEMFGSSIQRSLHAKFILSANSREGSARCSSTWVYLGSGNLTGPGFANSMSTTGGNLEVGMLLSPEGLYWYAEKGVSPSRIVSNLLPVQWVTDILAFEQLSAGESMPEHDDEPIPAPLAWLNWQVTEEGSILLAPEQTEVVVNPLNSDGTACECLRQGVWQWVGQPPRVVTLQWSIGEHLCSALIPILDNSGRLAATSLPTIGIDEVWWQLANFPQSTIDEDAGGDGDEGGIDSGNTGGSGASNSESAAYPIRRMMALVEQIAAKQIDLNELDWLTWCTRLEQSLMQAAKDPIINVFRSMKLNPLSPLRQPQFLPQYAEQASSPAGVIYGELLDRVEKSWEIVDLCKIGVSQ